MFSQADQKWVTVLLVPVLVQSSRRYVLARAFNADYFNAAIFNSDAAVRQALAALH